MDRGHVLIVDDEREILASLEGVLRDEGYRVDRAESGEMALQLVRTETPDVVLVDVWMPGIDGIKTLQAVKESNADVEVVVMSGHGDIETAIAATKLGAFHFIEKPLSIDAVLSVVDSAVQTRRARELRANDVAEAMIQGESRKMRGVRKAVRRVAKRSGIVVIAGERGTGKRVVSRAIHMSGAAKGEEFRPVHCRSLFPFSEKGDGERNLARLAPAAFQGTAYLDGLEQLTAGEREGFIERFLERTGDSTRLIISVDITGAPEDGAFIRSIAEKTGADVIHLPPLRERKEDIPTLADKFLDKCAEEAGVEKEFAEGVAALLQEYEWPGNIAELKGAVTSAAGSAHGAEIRIEHLPLALREIHIPEPEASESGTASRFHAARTRWERQYLSFHLDRNGWDVAKTAHAVGVPASALKRKIQTYGIERASPTIEAIGKTNQRSISKSVVLHGRGLHSGLKTGLIMEPMPPGSGIQFGALTSAETVRAHVDFVDGTNHATNLRSGAAAARTIEHLMSALHAYEISNVLIKTGEEVPVLDGSAVEFCLLLEEAGIKVQEEKRDELRVDRPCQVGEPDSGEGYIRIEPADSFSISYLIDYPRPIGKQSYLYEHEGAPSFREQIAPARTFGFASELEELGKMGLAEGGRWDNVILVDKGRIVNTRLRFPNEFVRHKILDVMGDLYLAGRPIRGKVTAQRSGHRHNVALVKKLVEAQG